MSGYMQKWNGAVVGYKVVYLTENARDNNYSYAGTVDTFKAKAGSTVEAGVPMLQNLLGLIHRFSFKGRSTSLKESLLLMEYCL